MLHTPQTDTDDVVISGFKAYILATLAGHLLFWILFPKTCERGKKEIQENFVFYKQWDQVIRPARESWSPFKGQAVLFTTTLATTTTTG